VATAYSPVAALGLVAVHVIDWLIAAGEALRAK